VKLLDTWEPRTVYIKPPENEALKPRASEDATPPQPRFFAPWQGAEEAWQGAGKPWQGAR